MSNLGLPILLLIFVAAAAAIWVAGVQLSNQTDVLSERLHPGAALGGLIMLAIATNLLVLVAGYVATRSGLAIAEDSGGPAARLVLSTPGRP